jgi:uncharacterized protein (TIGR03437 family)
MQLVWKRRICKRSTIIAALFATAVAGQTPVQFNPIPSRAVGHAQLQLVSTAPNLVEGREFNSPIGVAVDASVSPAILYVADTNNNRVLVWKDARAATGSKADFVIGQSDFFSTTALGPGSSVSAGLRAPTGVTVDRSGNVYVVDSGNNRILRYPRVTEQTDFVQPNLVIGQVNFSLRESNQGNSLPTAKTLSLSVGSTVFSSSATVDSAGNLWVADPGNSRVLRYPASALGNSAFNAPEADLVLGQTSLTTRQTVEWGRAESRLLKTAMLQPVGVGFDPAGRLLVTDDANRLLVFEAPFQSGKGASRIAGLVVNIQGEPPRPPVNEFTLSGPESVFANSSGIFVVETGSHRIVRFDPFEQWPAETELLPSPPARAVFGQPDMVSFRPNRGASEPFEASFQSPTGAFASNNELFVCDSGNNRLLVFPLSGATIPGAVRVLGQDGFRYRSVNLVEGREMYLVAGPTSIFGGTVFVGGAAVIDQTSNPPRLYVADTFNNRILGYADARRVKPGDVADIIIGQTSPLESKVNSPTADIDQLNDQGLYLPVGIAVDAQGNLFVADSGNGRVVRFPRPFEQPQRLGQRANLVLGQGGFNIKITDATQRTMARPYGVAFTTEGHLLVSDIAHHRVLLFRRAATGEFANGQNAATVFGQRDFVSSGSASDPTRFFTPMHIATDTDDRLYVCDSGNRRVAIFERANVSLNNPAPAISLTVGADASDRLGNIQGIHVSPRTGEIWVADSSNNRVFRYPRFDTLALNPFPNYLIRSSLPLAVSIDAFDNLLITEGTNRVAFHYPGLAAVSAAHYLRRRISPGMVAALYPLGISFGEETVVASAVPLPTELADIQVLVEEVPAPLYFVSPGQINFYVPMRLEPGTQISFLVQRKSTSQILASGVLDIGVATPSLFTTTQNGQGQIAALNEDNTVNTNTNGVARGQVIQLFATGQGKVDNAPPDGTPASGLTPTQVLPRIIIGSNFVDDKDILYSGLAPGLVGVWQINVKVPMSVPPNSATDVVVVMGSIPSNQPEGSGVIRTVIAVK